MTTLKELITPVTVDEARDSLLDILQYLGFQTTTWRSGDPLYSVCQFVAQLYADATESIYKVASGNYLDLAEGEWLTLLASSRFDVTRTAATYAVVEATLTAASGAGPIVIASGDLTCQTTAGLRFRNSTGGTLAAGPSTLDLEWTAETAGTAWNVADGEIAALVTAIPGVTIDNPGPASLITTARDAELDADLRARCRTRWATLAEQAPSAAYVSWALEASTEVTRVYVDDTNPDGPGSIRVYVAGAAGAPSGGAVTTVDTYLQARRAISSIVTTLAAVEVAVAVTATVYVRAGSPTDVTALEQAVEDYFESLPIGGDVVPALAPATFFVDQVEAAMFALDGVVTVTLTVPSADVALDPHEVAVPGAVTITVVTV